MVTLSSFLTGKRLERGLSRSNWARRSGISHASLWRWESGAAAPREAELATALQVLELTPAEERQAFRLLAEERQGRGIERIATRAGTPLIRSELLKSLRLRRQWTQAMAAEAATVSRVNLSRWESGERWPDRETLAHLCQTYGALPAEIDALTTLPKEVDGEIDDAASSTLRESRTASSPESRSPCSDARLLEMQYLTRLAQLTRVVAPREPNADVREATLRLEYAEFLLSEKRFAEARRELKRVEESGQIAKSPALLVRHRTAMACMGWAQKPTNSDRRKYVHLLERTLSSVSDRSTPETRNAQRYLTRMKHVLEEEQESCFGAGKTMA